MHIFISPLNTSIYSGMKNIVGVGFYLGTYEMPVDILKVKISRILCLCSYVVNMLSYRQEYINFIW